MEIKFSTSNSAFGEYDENDVQDESGKSYEIVRILKDIAKKVENGYEYGTIMDINGNKIGSWRI